ncbi:hypothetical protein WA026_015533 [Henosepilachna vigintioctopunctata]|uniref:KIF-binding protein n=1 Tax=Henosepilachna vigintioctopunctata TaxID=420089 RepID=A0AAW1VGW7_9CUCU
MASEILNVSELKELKNIFDKLKIHLNHEKSIDESNQLNNTIPTVNSDILESYFQQLLGKIERYLERSGRSSSEFIKLLTMKASLLYEQAKIKLFYESSIEEAKGMLQSTLELIENYSEHDYVIFLYLRIVNHLSYLLSKEGKFSDARQLLENILYREYSPNIAVYSTEDLFSLEQINAEAGKAKFNKLMLNNIQMLGWIYGKLGFNDLHAFMEHLYLQKQLDLRDMSILHWTSKCCRLVTIYLTSYNWLYARYYLASIGALLNKKSGEPRANAELPQARADLSKAWIHYGLHLFSASKKRLLEQIYDSSGNENSPSDGSKPALDVLDQHKFKGLTVTIPNIPINFITETQEARTLFLFTQNWLKQMRAFYTLRDYPLQYVNAVLDLSELYRFLAFYETDLESQYNVQKRRSDTLEALSTLLREVRPNCYVAVSVELWRELAEVQIELMGINLKRLYAFEGEKENAGNIKKRLDAVEEVHDKLETIGDSVELTRRNISRVQEKQELR